MTNGTEPLQFLIVITILVWKVAFAKVTPTGVCRESEFPPPGELNSTGKAYADP